MELKLDENKIKLARLSEEHRDILANFDCLNEEEVFEGFRSKQIKKFKGYSKKINEFLKSEALLEQNQGLNTTHLVFYEESLMGFVSLCSDSIRLEQGEMQKDNVPYGNIPAIKIARLAIDKNFQRNGLGSFLINFAVSIVSQIRLQMGAKFITVDCYAHRISYYEKFGFVINNIQNPNRQPDNPLSLRLNVDEYLENIIGKYISKDSD